MSILSTSSRLIKVGQGYSAGENIGIYDYVISSKDWSEEITQATSSVSGDVSALSAAIDYVSANAGHEYSGISPIGVDNSTYTISADTWVFSAGSGVSLVDDNENKVTRIDVTAKGGDEDVENLVKTSSGSWNDVSSKLDSTAFSNVSGDFATKTELETTSGAITSLIPTDYYPDSNPSGFISGVDLTPYQPVSSMSNYATTNDLEQVSGDITALIPDTSNFITNSSAESTYQTIDGMTAYQPTGSYITLNDFNYGVIYGI